MSAKNIILGAIAVASVASGAQAKTQTAVEKRLDEMEKTIDAQRAEIDSLKAQVAQTPQQPAEDVATVSDLQQIQQAVAESTAATKKATKGWWSDTKVTGRMYWDLSTIQHDINGVDQPDQGVGFDIKRFYIGVDHKFNDIFSGNITTDFQYSSALSATELYIKKAYLEAKLSDALVIRAGSTDLPWVPFVEDVYGYRYVENTLIDRTKFGTSADWGVHASGKLAGGLVNYAVAVVDGAGYKKPLRSQGMDVEGRVNLNYQSFIVGVGGYYGKLGKDTTNSATKTTSASRFDALVAYKTDTWRLGAEYFSADDWAVTSKDSAEGYGVFGSYQFNPQWGVFARYDYVEPNQDTKSKLSNDYYNVGISYSPAKIVDFSLVYKHDTAENGTIADSNGTIGGSIDGDYDEIGIFSQFRF